MKISEAKKGLRVMLSTETLAQHMLDPDVAISLDRSMLISRHLGTLRSGRVIRLRPPYEEGLVVYVVWDGLKTPEAWHLTDLSPARPTPEPE